MTKTYKRETALALLVVLCGLYIASLWYPPAFDVAEAMKYETFIFASGAFAIDAYAKQIK